MRLEGKRVLITGTAGGQGEAAQALFASEGARLVGCDVREGAAERTADALRSEGHDVTGFTVDLADPDAARRWIDDGAALLSGIDVLYNNAAGYGGAPFKDMTVELWRHVMRVELDIVFHTTQPAWRHLMDGGGTIVNTASMAAVRGLNRIGHAAHAAAKGGIIGLTKVLAAEGAEHGIRANAISPSMVISPVSMAELDDEMREFSVNMHLIRRPGRVEDVAYLALYLASDESSWVTGQNYSIDGGATAGFR